MGEACWGGASGIAGSGLRCSATPPIAWRSSCGRRLEPEWGNSWGKPQIESPSGFLLEGLIRAWSVGSGGRIRTYDQVINSHPLYH
jgi:hypothetical protein